MVLPPESETDEGKSCYSSLQRQSLSPGPELVIIDSPYRVITRPLLAYIDRLQRENPDAMITVLMFNQMNGRQSLQLARHSFADNAECRFWLRCK